MSCIFIGLQEATALSSLPSEDEPDVARWDVMIGILIYIIRFVSEFQTSVGELEEKKRSKKKGVVSRGEPYVVEIRCRVLTLY